MLPTLANTTHGPIEYRLEGAGPVIMVLNGGHCSRHTRLSHERLAGEGFSVLTPSRPGYDATPSAAGRTAQEAAGAMAALLDTLQITAVDLVGISAAGPTALAFAARYPERTHKLVMESAVATAWNDNIKRFSRIPFGRAEKTTWALMRLLLRINARLAVRLFLRELTILNTSEVVRRMSPDDLAFVKRLMRTLQSGTGFLNDIKHTVDDLSEISAPTLVMFSPNDKSVSPQNARRIAEAVEDSELFEVPSDTHLIWIGSCAAEVWQKRLSFLRA